MMATVAATRPPVPDWLPDGFTWVAAPAPGWRLATGKPCRLRGGKAKACAAPSIAELNRERNFGRTRKEAWWAYCPVHVAGYGHWIENGQVMRWQAKITDAKEAP